MQQAPFAWSGYPNIPQRPKHRLDELDDLGQTNAHVPVGSAARPFSNGVTFSEDNIQAANAFVASAKRRKSNTGKAAIPADLEPQFEHLSLRNTVSSEYDRDQPLYSTLSSASPVIEELPSVNTSSPASGRHLHAHDSSRGRRAGTPPISVLSGTSSSHRKRSSSRNRARKSSSTSDADMKPAPRYDPARPHVVFVDTLSDSDDEDAVQTSDSEATSGDLSGFSTPGNSPSSSDAEDNVNTASLRGTSRPIHMNKRLREHLRRQAMMQSLGHKPVTEGVLADAAPTTGGAGVNERGLVLYRPLSWGIVEEPDDNISDSGYQRDERAVGDGVRIQELPIDAEALPPAINMSGGDELEALDSMEVDQEMEIDD